MSNESPIRTYKLPFAVMYEYDTYVHTILNDGADNFFHPPLHSLDYQCNAVEMGYSSAMRYGVEHEVAHHLIADALHGKISNIIYRACHRLPMSMEEKVYADEEHLVNRFQRYVNLGIPDPYGVLEGSLGEQLNKTALLYITKTRPWLF